MAAQVITCNLFWQQQSMTSTSQVLHAIVQVLHLYRLPDEELGLSPLFILDGFVDIHNLFTDVFVHFG